MPELAKSVVLNLARRALAVDGKEFPWILTEDGPKLSASHDGLIQVTVCFMAESAEVIGHNAEEIRDA